MNVPYTFRVCDGPSYLRNVYEPALDSSMLAMPSLEWQVHLSNSHFALGTRRHG